MSKRALIFGVGGQDGSFLCEHLLSLGYRVTGTHRRSSVDNLWRIKEVVGHPDLELVQCDLTDTASMEAVLATHPAGGDSFDEVYNLADQDHVASSLSTPGYSANVTYGGAARLLNLLLAYGDAKDDLRVFQPSSATIFGDEHTHLCDENADFNPQSPYAVAKLGALYLARYYRSRGLRVWCGILYGHASTRQKPEYLVHRIAKSAVDATRSGDEVWFKDADFVVDVGHAQDFVRGYHAMLQTDKPDDYVMSVGRGYSIRYLMQSAFYESGARREEPFADPDNSGRCVIGDCSKAEAAFGWAPERDAVDVVGELVDFYSQEKR